MSIIEISGQHFNCGKLPTRTQWHVVRRLMPVIQGMMPLFAASEQMRLNDAGDGTVSPLDAVNVFDALSALTNTIGMLNDQDADYIIDAALNCVRWRQGDRWMPIRAPGGAFMIGTADEFDVQIRLLWEVLRESLANFTPANIFPSPAPNGLDPMEPTPPLRRTVRTAA